MGEVRRDPAGIEYFEVARGKYVAGKDYADAIEQHEEFGYGWTVRWLDEIGCGPLEFVRFEPRPKKGKS